MRDLIYSSYMNEGIEYALNVMIKKLYDEYISSFLGSEFIELVVNKEMDLTLFSNKELRRLKDIEPYIQSIEFKIPASSDYAELLFNDNRDGIVLIDTVGTDHTGIDSVDSIFGVYEYNKYIPDMIAFINDVNKFRSKENGMKSIFSKIIKENKLNNFLLVNTKLDKELCKDDIFIDLRENKNKNKDIPIETNNLEKFMINEQKFITQVQEDIKGGLELAIDDYFESSGMKENISGNVKKELIIEKIMIKAICNSIYLSNPETDKRFHRGTIDEEDVELLNSLSNYKLNDEIVKFINTSFENYVLLQNANNVYLKIIDEKLPLLSVKSETDLEKFAESIIEYFISQYENLQFPYFNSMRALSNGFSRKTFTADSSYFRLCFPNSFFIDTIHKFIVDNKRLDFLTINYEIDSNRINRDDMIFENIDPILSEKLPASFDYYFFVNNIWEELKKELVELKQYDFPKRVDQNWNTSKKEEMKLIFFNYYKENNISEYIGDVKLSDNRWDLMGDLIGYQIKYILTKNRKIFNEKIVYYIKDAIDKLHAKVGIDIKISDKDTNQGENLEIKIKGRNSRLAYVIGISEYTDWSKLNNPRNDVESMKNVLEKSGFDVKTFKDLNFKDFNQVIYEFGHDLKNYDTGLLYYAGHGVEISGENYLIPTNAEISSITRISQTSINISRLFEQMMDDNSYTYLVILDACRTKFSLSESRGVIESGLSNIMPPKGTFISFSTSPNSTASDGVGDNGLFTKVLTECMVEEGIKIEELFKKVRTEVLMISKGKQMPWEHSSLIGDFYFVESKRE